MKDLYFKATRDNDIEIKKIAVSSFLEVNQFLPTQVQRVDRL